MPTIPGAKSDCHIHCTVLQVLQGFMYLGSVEELGREVASAFTSTVNTTVVQVTWQNCCVRHQVLPRFHRVTSAGSAMFCACYQHNMVGWFVAAVL